MKSIKGRIKGKEKKKTLQAVPNNVRISDAPLHHSTSSYEFFTAAPLLLEKWKRRYANDEDFMAVCQCFYNEWMTRECGRQGVALIDKQTGALGKAKQ